MRVLDLSGHYQRPVEVDTCAHCCLVWFDGTESVRLAGPGIAGLVREIHGAMQAGGEHAHAVSLARVQTCPVCGKALKASPNMTRFGRTTHLECPQGHGYYQTYILYLAEKGFVRPLAWGDIRTMLAEGKEMFCASCGCPLPARPQDECPACRSAIGIIDPTRLASAIDPDGVAATIATATPAAAAPPHLPAHDAPLTPDAQAAPEAPAAREAPLAAARTAVGAAGLRQHKCHACGGAVDPTRDIHCPHCRAPVLRQDTVQAAAAAGAASEALLRANDERQHPAVSRTKLAAAQYAMVDFEQERNARRLHTLHYKLLLGLLLGAIAFAVIAWYRQPGQRQNWTPQETTLLAHSHHFRPPAMECDLQSSVRREAHVRQLIVAPVADDGGSGSGASPVKATLGALRAAHVRAIAVRHQWQANGAFELLAGQDGNPFAPIQAIQTSVVRRGEAPALVDEVAFCLPVNEVSPPLLAHDGFHLIQVVEAR